MFDVLSYYLENGMRVILHRENKTRVVKAGIIMNQGSMNECDENSGISHFLEHMLISENNNNPNIKLHFEDLHNYGASYNASTYKANTIYYINGLAEGLQTYLKLLKEIVFCNRTFDETILNREKQIVERELVSYYSSFNQITDRAIQALYGEKSFGRIVVGKKECIQDFSVQDITDLVSNTYTPENAAIAIFGDIDYYEVIKIIDSLFSGLSDCNTLHYNESVQQTPNIYFNPNYKGEHAVASICFRKTTHENPEFINNTLLMMSNALCDSTLSKRIGYLLRKDNGLAYNIGGFNMSIKQHYAGGVTAVFKLDNAAEVVKVIVENLNIMREEGFSEKELGKIKKNIIAKKLYTRSDMSTQAEHLLKLALNPTIYSPDNEIRFIEKLNIDEVNKCIYDILNPENIGLACIGNCNIDEIITAFSS